MSHMTTVLLAFVLVTLTIYFVPFLTYGLASIFWGLEIPEGASPARFLASVLISKIGTAIAFVWLFYAARDVLAGQWLLYAGIWWVMFILGEIGQAIGPNYSWKEAVLGAIAETIYLPLAAWLTDWLIG